MREFEQATLLITGGTGSFGNAVLKRFADSALSEIRILSRDEKKQDDLRKLYADERIKFYIGDVRDRDSIDRAMIGVDYVFHAAALKQVPSCEFFPIEAVKTNVLGTQNVLLSARACGVKRVVTLSTDKAVYPINAMGLSKGMMEKTMVAESRNNNDQTVFCGTRYGNVMASRGSVIPLFIDQIQSGQDLTLTDPQMTRFMMTLDDAVDLVIHAFLHGENGDIFVQKAPASTIEVLAQALKDLLSADNNIRIIGTRHGEKLYESLVSTEEMGKAEDEGEYFRIPADNRSLNYDRYFSSGSTEASIEDYNSHNTYRMNVDETKELLMKLDVIKNLV